MLGDGAGVWRSIVVDAMPAGAYELSLRVTATSRSCRGSLIFRLLLQAQRMPKRPHHDCSRPLPRTLIIPEVMTLATLADVRVLVEGIRPHSPGKRQVQLLGRERGLEGEVMLSI